MSKCGFASATKTWSRYLRWVTITGIESDVRLHVIRASIDWKNRRGVFGRDPGDDRLQQHPKIRVGPLLKPTFDHLDHFHHRSIAWAPPALLGLHAYEATSKNETWAKCSKWWHVMFDYGTTFAISACVMYCNIAVSIDISAFEVLQFQYLMYCDMFLDIECQYFWYWKCMKTMKSNAYEQVNSF